MLKFFRQIRKRLLSQGNTQKYLQYAFGEILLVVIGILIALQINNWNQNRLDDIEERRILTAISEEVELSKFLFERGSHLQANKLLAAKNLLKEIQLQKINPDQVSLDENFDNLTKRWLSGTLTSIYDALIGSGDFKLVSSDELRNELASLKSDQEFLVLFEEIQIKFEDERLNPILNQYINRSTIRTRRNGDSRMSDIPLTPFKTSYSLLLKNTEFANVLVELCEHTSRVLSNYERLGRSIERVDSLANNGDIWVENNADTIDNE